LEFLDVRTWTDEPDVAQHVLMYKRVADTQTVLVLLNGSEERSFTLHLDPRTIASASAPAPDCDDRTSVSPPRQEPTELYDLWNDRHAGERSSKRVAPVATSSPIVSLARPHPMKMLPSNSNDGGGGGGVSIGKQEQRASSLPPLFASNVPSATIAAANGGVSSPKPFSSLFDPIAVTLAPFQFCILELRSL
jgi:hypothetical protein